MESRRERYEGYIAAGDRVDEIIPALAEINTELTVPLFPDALSYLWRIYHRLRRRKSMGFNGFNRIEWPDILAFTTMTKTRLAPWEVKVIEDVDDAFVSVMAADENTPLIPSDANAAAKEGLRGAAPRSVVARKGGQ